jgi:hypothetical protein
MHVRFGSVAAEAAAQRQRPLFRVGRPRGDRRLAANSSHSGLRPRPAISTGASRGPLLTHSRRNSREIGATVRHLSLT